MPPARAPEPFAAPYADLYDALYHDKDYPAECDLVQRIIADVRLNPARSILDLGCGTGRHASLLAARGFDILGVDRSQPMIERAIARSSDIRSTHPPQYRVADLRSFRIDRRFDVALMMFAVIGYQLDDADVLAALSTARVHLRDGGLFLMDCWHAPAVLRQRPSTRSKSVATPSGPVVRTSTATLDESRRRITIRFRIDRDDPTRNAADRASTIASQADETHVIRYFHPDELDAFLRASGFSLHRIGAMPDFDRDPDDSTWNVLAAATAR